MRIPFLPEPAKYLNLCGDPLGYPAALNFLLRPEFLTAAAAVTLATAADKEDRFRIDALVGASIAVAGGQYLRKKMGTNAIDTVIDTTPNENNKISPTPKSETLHQIYSQAKNLTYGQIGASGGWLAATTFFPDYYPAIPTYTIPAMLITMSPITGFIALTSRKIIKGDWALTKQPT